MPYVDPGLPLAVAIRDEVRRYMDEQGEAPKVILLQNHGLIALGQTPTEALNITAMCVKAAKIFTGTCAVGEPVFMSPEDIKHIYFRPDEIYRRQMFVRCAFIASATTSRRPIFSPSLRRAGVGSET
ncbi:MAG: class II aldolase/adducin family protein [Chloroflexi bacterium]|nr:class II aldolase/adducin family protein [Chloroflexota bacterium]